MLSYTWTVRSISCGMLMSPGSPGSRGRWEDGRRRWSVGRRRCDDVDCVLRWFDCVDQGQAAGHRRAGSEHQCCRSDGHPSAVGPPDPHPHRTTVSRLADIEPPPEPHSNSEFAQLMSPIGNTEQFDGQPRYVSKMTGFGTSGARSCWWSRTA